MIAAVEFQLPKSVLSSILSDGYVVHLNFFFPLFSDFSKSAISNTLYVLIVSSTCLDSLSNGANNFFMFHQKYVLNKEKLKTRFQSKTQLSHNGLPKLAILQDKLDL